MKVSNETKVGALTVIAVTLIIIGFNVLRGKTMFKSGNFIHAKFTDTKGLIVSNPVFINGYQVGAIFDIENGLNQLENFPYHDYPLNQVRGAHHNVISFMSDQHPVRNYSEAKDFIKRTDLVKDVFAGQLDWLKKQAAVGVYAPGFVYDHIINQLNELINYSADEH